MMTGFVPFDVEPESASEVLVTIISLFFGFITQCVIISSATSALQGGPRVEPPPLRGDRGERREGGRRSADLMYF